MKVKWEIDEFNGLLFSQDSFPEKKAEALRNFINDWFSERLLDVNASISKAAGRKFTDEYDVYCNSDSMTPEQMLALFSREFPNGEIKIEEQQKPPLKKSAELEWRYFSNPGYTIRSSKSHDLSFLEDVKKEMAEVFGEDKVSIKVSTDDKSFEVQLENVGVRMFCDKAELKLRPAQDRHPSTRTNLFTGR